MKNKCLYARDVVEKYKPTHLNNSLHPVFAPVISASLLF